MEDVTNQILRHFAYMHLPRKYADIAHPFSDLAFKLDRMLPNGPEKSTALRKLLESKDAAVRSGIDI